MLNNPILIDILRIMHILAAAGALGGLLVMRLVVPRGLAPLDEAHRDAFHAAARLPFKILIHACILFFLISGILNSIRLFPAYSLQPGVLHGIWGLHMLLGLCGITVAILLLKGRPTKSPSPSHRKAAMVNIAILILAVVMASVLKQLREAAERSERSQNQMTQPDTTRTVDRSAQ